MEWSQAPFPALCVSARTIPQAFATIPASRAGTRNPQPVLRQIYQGDKAKAVGVSEAIETNQVTNTFSHKPLNFKVSISIAYKYLDLVSSKGHSRTFLFFLHFLSNHIPYCNLDLVSSLGHSRTLLFTYPVKPYPVLQSVPESPLKAPVPF